MRRAHSQFHGWMNTEKKQCGLHEYMVSISRKGPACESSLAYQCLAWEAEEHIFQDSVL